MVFSVITGCRRGLAVTAGLQLAGQETSAIGEVQTAAPPTVILSVITGCRRGLAVTAGLRRAGQENLSVIASLRSETCSRQTIRHRERSVAICLLTESAKRKADCRAPYSGIQRHNRLPTGASDGWAAARWSGDQRNRS